MTESLRVTGLQIYASFYCRQNEPSYIKMLKLEILSAIADESNAYDITTELTEYVTDIDEPLGRAAVKAVGRIALEVSASHGCCSQLLKLASSYCLAELDGYANQDCKFVILRISMPRMTFSTVVFTLFLFIVSRSQFAMMPDIPWLNKVCG